MRLAQILPALVALVPAVGQAGSQIELAGPFSTRESTDATAQVLPELRESCRPTSLLCRQSCVDVTGDQRTRYESLNNRYRRDTEGSDQGLFLRNRLQIELRSDVSEVAVELMDCRGYLRDSGSKFATSQVNAIEPIQIYGARHMQDVLWPCDELLFQAGRLTMDVGSRRLVARNRFRNTVNTFTGLNVIWTADSGESLQAFWTLPIQRLPFDQQGLSGNGVVFDSEHLDVQFWGVVGALPKCIGNAYLEGYGFGLHEDDSPGRKPGNRELYTIGFRTGTKPISGRFDFELESAVQFGTSRQTVLSEDTTDLDHAAFFQHAELGYTWEVNSKLRAAFQFDYASGDADPFDNENNRFDTLFGARRFEFGPTGIYGPFARSNLVTPGYRITFTQFSSWKVMFAHRLYWLASSTDAWTTAALQDVTGASGRYLGHQPEIRIRCAAVPDTITVDAGTAYHFKGRFVNQAPGSTGQGDASYVYIQSTIIF
jgi:hypothetical protein